MLSSMHLLHRSPQTPLVLCWQEAGNNLQTALIERAGFPAHLPWIAPTIFAIYSCEGVSPDVPTSKMTPPLRKFNSCIIYGQRRNCLHGKELSKKTPNQRPFSTRIPVSILLIVE